MGMIKNAYFEFQLEVMYSSKYIWTWPDFVISVFSESIMDTQVCHRSQRYELTDVNNDNTTNIVTNIELIFLHPNALEPEEFFKDVELRINRQSELNTSLHIQLKQCPFNGLPLGALGFYSCGLKNINCSEAIAMNSLQFCETIAFSETEYELISFTDEVLISGNLLFPRDKYTMRSSTENKDEVHICLEEYLKEDHKYWRVHSTSQSIRNTTPRLRCFAAVLILFSAVTAYIAG